ncbi:MAG: type II 3-dehydroquinate dehydratase [Bacteriovoracaceae bacterium]
MKRFLILNGPNLNLIGTREPDIYGNLSLAQIQEHTQKKLEAHTANSELTWFQSNIEGELINKIQEFTREDYAALVINPGGFSHTSVAIYDALRMVKRPVIEVHLTNIYAREEFRQSLLTAKAASKIMCGLGKDAYFIAVLSEILS